jgi:hypothetical protein
MLVLSDERMDVSIVSVGIGSLQATTTCCSVMSVFLFLKFFTD